MSVRVIRRTQQRNEPYRNLRQRLLPTYIHVEVEWFRSGDPKIFSRKYWLLSVNVDKEGRFMIGPD